MRASLNLTVAVVVLLAVPALAGAAVITNGIDTWSTPGDGSSFVDFRHDPIPAGFFCSGSEPFTGRISWQGAPLASEPAGALGNADTIVQRLDNAVFDREGRASTRLQVRALSLASIQPIRTRCGAFDVTASLRGAQPVTTMEIVQDAPGRGTFVGPLALHVKLVFTPVRAATSRPLVLERNIELDAPRAPWASEPSPGMMGGQVGGFVLIDTDGDQVADTFVPGQSAFFPRGPEGPQQISQCMSPPGAYCHTLDGSTCHCNYP